MFCTTTTEFARRPGVTDADIEAAIAQFGADVEHVLDEDELGVSYTDQRVYVEIAEPLADVTDAPTICDGIVALAHALAGEVVTIRQSIEDGDDVFSAATTTVAGPKQAVRDWLLADHADRLAALQADHAARLAAVDRLTDDLIAVELPNDDC